MKLKELKQSDRFTLAWTPTETHEYWEERGIKEATFLGKNIKGEFNYWATTPAGEYELYLEENGDIDVIKVTTTVEAAIAESYLQRQAEWIEKNGIKPGTKLKVTRAAKNREDGWGNSWTHTMNKYVGSEVVFRRDAGLVGIACTDLMYDFPYFVLEPVPVKPPEPPYADRQAEWVKKHNIKPGSLVRFSRKWDAAEFSTPVNDSKKDVGKVLVVSEVRNDRILLKRSDGRYFPAWTVPYFVLEPIALPEGYRLMGDDEIVPEGAMFYGANKHWIRAVSSIGSKVQELKKQSPTYYWAFACKEPGYKPYAIEDHLLAVSVLNKTTKSKHLISAMSTTGVYLPGVGQVSYDVLLRDYTFSSGSPCGKKV